MHPNTLFFAAAATAVASAQDLATALAGQSSLTMLVALLGQVSNTTEFLASHEKVTLFAPNDDAFAGIVQSGGIFSIDQASVDPGLIEQILRYHLYRGVVKAEDITPVPNFIHSYLNYSGFVLDGEVSGSNVTGGQVVSVNLNAEGDALVTAGIKVASKVTVADITFDNGIIHIIDKLLLIPLSISETLITGNFTALAGAATQAGLVPTLEDLSDVTIFCPNNDAFQKIASGTGNITDEQLAEILKYHVVQGTVGYSTLLSNSSLATLDDEEVKITIDDDGAVFVNSARVINADILVANGVIHVIDEVLNPANPYATPSENATATATTSLATFVPFTSGIEPETSVYFELTQTTSFVAAGLVTGTPSATNGSGNSSVTTTSGPVIQTTNAGGRNDLPALAAAVAIGALAFAIDW
ncbi:hypothetical protein LTR97_006353 [Elasticomyces elasticus]|uniref:FAS1 domain-containing protein n=1 Tax=Elasticomyces elasticus TaxID=574655 RepID=A0AAN7W6D4_9PEZI|nr:hypothetical protein LTR97_006353 [Elasticomyces elasticus]